MSQRRRRVRDENDDFSSPSHLSLLEDGLSPPSSKRQRIDEGSEDEASPILPDNFRRSPKGKGQSRDMLFPGNSSHNHDEQTHHPGSIVRVKLTDFVTYAAAEFHPGPSLNMVIGPNGTGKSTLVCAICIGLGWSTSHLGRAKDVCEFVKHGKKRAMIEIELKADPERHSHNPVITHIINRDGGNKAAKSKSEFLIDGKKSNSKTVQELARSFSIQVDNLCQFLPQDRVVEFAALSPVDLLVHTQRAAAPQHMVEWHEELKALGKKHKQQLVEQQSLVDDLRSKEERQRSQEELVNRLRERTALKERINMLEKMKPFAEYAILKKEHLDAKEQRKAASKEYRRLERRMQPNIDQVNAKKEYHNLLENAVGSRERLLAKTGAVVIEKQKEVEKATADVESCDNELAAESQNGKKAKESIAKFQNEIRKTERLLENEPESFDAAAMNHEIREKALELRRKSDEISDNDRSVSELQTQSQQRQEIIEDLENKKTHLQSQAGRQTSQLEKTSRDAARAWQWIQRNRNQFEGHIFGPPMIECSVKDFRHVNAVETLIGRSELLSFTVTNQRDFKKLSDQLHNQRISSISIRSSIQPLTSFRPACSNEEMKRLGGEAWLLDLIDGPDEVLAMLCDNRNIHNTVFTSKELSKTQHEAFERSNIPAYIASQQLYQITRRREYGDAGNSVRVIAIKRAALLGDAPIDTQEEQDIDRQIRERQSELEVIKNELSGLLIRKKQLLDDKARLKKVHDDLKEEKDLKQTQRSEYDGLGLKLENYQRRLQEARETIREQAARKMAIVDRRDKLYQDKGQRALDYARAVDTLRGLHVSLFEAAIMRIEAKSDLDQLDTRNKEEQVLLERCQEEVERQRATEEELRTRGRELEQRCHTLGRSLNESEEEYYEEMKDKWDLTEMETEMHQVQATLDMLHGGNEGLIKEFEDRAIAIERKRGQLLALQESSQEVKDQITNIRERWEPELDRLVGQISEAFAENFQRISCAGEVAVYKDDDFEQWAIQIMVKFRENEQLSILDSHRQSGGERAVSTIFYLMALQSLARAPFRVVDEINQGMDPRNERLVHSRMVSIACEGNTSQYFLITPKLLNNLTYHPNMKVHCIASGEYMPSDHRELDFGMLAKKALAIRACAR